MESRLQESTDLWWAVGCLHSRGWYTREPRIKERQAIAERTFTEKEAREVSQLDCSDRRTTRQGDGDLPPSCVAPLVMSTQSML